MNGKLVRIKTEDDLELHGLLCDPGSDKIIIHLHGWAGNFYENKFLDDIASKVNKKGFAFLTFNNRGVGYITDYTKGRVYEQIGGCLEKFEECILDIKSAIDFVLKKGFKTIILQGHSLGCQKVTYYKFKTKDDNVSKMILLAPVDDVAHFKTMFDEKKRRESFKIARDLLKEGKGKDPLPKWMQFFPMLSANMFIQVSDSGSSAGRIFDFSGKLEEIKNVNCPVLAIFGDKDDYQKNSKQMLDILREKANCDVKLLEGNHWFKGSEKELAKTISDWITK